MNITKQNYLRLILHTALKQYPSIMGNNAYDLFYILAEAFAKSGKVEEARASAKFLGYTCLFKGHSSYSEDEFTHEIIDSEIRSIISLAENNRKEALKRERLFPYNYQVDGEGLSVYVQCLKTRYADLYGQDDGHIPQFSYVAEYHLFNDAASLSQYVFHHILFTMSGNDVSFGPLLHVVEKLIEKVRLDYVTQVMEDFLWLIELPYPYPDSTLNDIEHRYWVDSFFDLLVEKGLWDLATKLLSRCVALNVVGSEVFSSRSLYLKLSDQSLAPNVLLKMLEPLRFRPMIHDHLLEDLVLYAVEDRRFDWAFCHVEQMILSSSQLKSLLSIMNEFESVDFDAYQNQLRWYFERFNRSCSAELMLSDLLDRYRQYFGL